MITHQTAVSLMHHINTVHAGNKRQFGLANNTTGQRVNAMTPANGTEEDKPMFIVVGNDLYRLTKENIK